MKTKFTIPYKIKCLLPIAAFAGASLFSGCEEKPEPIIPTKTVNLEFDSEEGANLSADTLQKYSADPTVANIYYTLRSNADFCHFSQSGINTVRKLLEPRFEESEKVKGGRGNFKFTPNVVAVADSLWFVQHGWTVNQKKR